MYLVEAVPEDNAGLDEAVATYEAAVAARAALTVGSGTPETIAAHKRVNAAAAAVARAHTTTFGLSRLHLVTFRRAMLRLGMTVDNGCPELPVLPAGTTPDDLAVAAHPDRWPDREPKPELLAYNQAWENVRSWHMDPPRAIEAHKLSVTHQSWLITPAECDAALDTYRRVHSTPDVVAVLDAAAVNDFDLWNRWIDFLTRAQRQGGFRIL